MEEPRLQPNIERAPLPEKGEAGISPEMLPQDHKPEIPLPADSVWESAQSGRYVEKDVAVEHKPEMEKEAPIPVVKDADKKEANREDQLVEQVLAYTIGERETPPDVGPDDLRGKDPSKLAESLLFEKE